MIEEIEYHLSRGQWKMALDKSNELVFDQPSNATAHALVGLSHYRMGDFAEAIEPLKRAVALDDQYWEAGTKLAQALDRLQHYEEALEIVSTFLKVRPSDPTLIHLKNGLERQVPTRITDSWQKSIHLDWHHVELTHQD